MYQQISIDHCQVVVMEMNNGAYDRVARNGLPFRDAVMASMSRNQSDPKKCEGQHKVSQCRHPGRSPAVDVEGSDDKDVSSTQL
jgi:hypothetical protein